MTRYQKLKQQIETTGVPAYCPYVMLGYPTAEKSLDVCHTLVKEGVNAFELGLPFRDPIADGPIVAQAGNVALDNGMTITKAVELVHKIRNLSPTIPLTLMSYYNMVLARTPDRFIREFAEAGLDGILIPDLPPERAKEIHSLTQKYGIDLVLIASPLSDDTRLALINEYVGGFTYVITRLGVTGINSQYSDRLKDLFVHIHKHITVPAFAGFGISEPEHAAKMIADGADGVITGSRLVQLIDESSSNGEWDLAPIVRHTRNMIAALREMRIARFNH